MSSKQDDPAIGNTWGRERLVRAQLLYELLVEAGGAAAPPARHLHLQGARITGRLDLEAATLRCPASFEDCSFEESIVLNQAHAATIRLPGCHLPGLAAQQLETQGNLELHRGFSAGSEVDLEGARIGGKLLLDGATLRSSTRRALNGIGLIVTQEMSCEGLHAEGEVSLLAAHIGGRLRFDGARLRNSGRIALRAGGLTVDQGMFCSERFTAEGEVRLFGAHIGALLLFDGATLRNPGRVALRAGGLTVDQGMFCSKRFTAEGEVRLRGAHIGGQLNFDDATLRNPTGRALDGERLSVTQQVSCSGGFQADGEVRLRGAHIGGQLNFDDATLRNQGGVALCADGLSVDLDMSCSGKFLVEGTVRLRKARLGGLFDAQDSWPARLILDGLTYDYLEATPKVPARRRLDWLRRDPDGYAPQPYEQLAAAYRRAGQPENARVVLITKQWDRRSTLNPLGKAWNWLLWATVGYGYRAWLAAVWLAGLLVLGHMRFTQAYAAELLVPRDPQDRQPAFHAVGYALDLLLPIVNLGQEGAWIPRGWAIYWTWGFTLVGWMLTTAVVAGFTGILKRD
jgi:hypothetical protein